MSDKSGLKTRFTLGTAEHPASSKYVLVSSLPWDLGFIVTVPWGLICLCYIS